MRFLSLIVFMLLFIGCAQLEKLRERTTSKSAERTATVDTTSAMPYDPMQLGPDVFALASAKEAEEAKSEAPHPSQGFRIQIGAFAEQERAIELANRSEQVLHVKSYVAYDKPFYRVRIGNCDTMPQAEVLKASAIERGFTDARITADTIETAPKP